MQNAIPKILFASQCFFKAYQRQKKVPGIEATIWDLVNSTEAAVTRNISMIVHHSVRTH